MPTRAALLLCAGILFIPGLHAQAPQNPRTDFYGDPLPDGAIARLGRLRFNDVSRFDPAIDVVRYSPDGKRIATMVYNQRFRLHDASTGKRIAGPWELKPNPHAFAFSPDGSTLAVGGIPSFGQLGALTGEDNNKLDVIWLFNLARASVVKKLRGKAETIRALAFADGGKTMISAADGTIRWWDVASGKKLRSWQPFAGEPKLGEGAITQTKTFFDCALAPGGESIAIHAFADADPLPPRVGNPKPRTELGAVGINLATRKITWRIDRKTSSSSNPNAATMGAHITDTSFAFSADGKCVAIAIPSEKVQLRDTATGKLLFSPPADKGDSDAFGGLALSADGAKLAHAGPNSRITIWTKNPSTKAPTYTARGFVARVAQFKQNSTHALDISPDGKTLLVAVAADIQRYDIATLKEIK